MDRARALAEHIETAAWSIINPDDQARAGRLAEVAAGAGDLDRAQARAGQGVAVAQSIANWQRHAQALAGLARTAAPKQARSMLAQALSLGAG